MTEPRPPLDCGAAVQQLWDFLDEELTVERMEAMRQHLDDCGHCLPHAEFAARFLGAVQSTRDARCCPESVRSRVLDMLREAGFKRS